jgi:tagatose-6-phosphate ketose/aldose isomerase
MTEQFCTKKEIAQQIVVWKKVYEVVANNKTRLFDILKVLQADNSSEVIFTGAGSSFFVGEMVAGYFMKNTGVTARAVSSTEIVTHPDLFINPSRRTMLVSFARSGNSPESIAAIDKAGCINNNIINLIVTCNAEGDLSLKNDITNKFVLTMPEESNDKGLAMTSSVTSMALASILFSRIYEIESLESQVDIASNYAKRIIENYSETINEIASLDFSRAVFLGSGSFIGIAREGHLKLQELTDGKIICKFDSFLAFRHGPKVVVNEDTLVVYMFSNVDYVLQYELDLVKAIKQQHNPKCILSISENKLEGDYFDKSISLSENNEKLDEEFLLICSVIPAQLLGFYKSINVGLNPDSPSNSGAIHRVVQGVTIYDYKK